MYLANLGLINWANLPNQHFHFDRINMINGESGTGKTTLLDAIQTLMTAAKKGLYNTTLARTKSLRVAVSAKAGHSHPMCLAVMKSVMPV
ncbi:MAG: AAA family ATPase [Oceanospirillaceae bacterium]|nr:AAA family ATPase [Oceanospirillaceae bacterium]